MKYVASYQEFVESRFIKIAFIGDIMQHERQVSYYLKNGYDMSDVFTDILPILKGADFVVGNLETTFSGEPYTYILPTNQKKFSVPDEFVKVLDKTLNLDLLTLANNHILDGGTAGLKRTTNLIANNNMIWLGVKGESSVNLKIRGLPFKFFNYTTVLNRNELVPTSNENPDDTVLPYEQVKKEVKIVSIFPGVDKVIPDKNYHNIILMHWGNDFDDANDEQIAIAKELLQKGFLAVIGGHSHTPRPAIYDNIHKNLKMFSLGNFISDQDDWRSPPGFADKGKILMLYIDINGIQKYQEFDIESQVSPRGITKINLIR